MPHALSITHVIINHYNEYSSKSLQCDWMILDWFAQVRLAWEVFCTLGSTKEVSEDRRVVEATQGGTVFREQIEEWHIWGQEVPIESLCICGKEGMLISRLLHLARESWVFSVGIRSTEIQVWILVSRYGCWVFQWTGKSLVDSPLNPWWIHTWSDL